MDRRFGLKPTSTAFAGAGALLASSWAMPLNLSAESNPERATNAASRDAKAPSVAEGPALSTNQGVRIPDDDNSLKAGARRPTLLEGFHFREKMMHFDHEPMHERVVHPRGSAAHGYFQVYKPLTQYTKAAGFADLAVRTPVFVRFSNVNGSCGTAETIRGARGFATKFWTKDGVWDRGQ
jgi:catalase